jgi:hypothetical protein
MHAVGLHEKQHSKHVIRRYSDLFMKKTMNIGKTKNIESNLMHAVDLHEKQHSIRVTRHHVDLNKRDAWYEKKNFR